jgi:hypothetical protein
MQRHARVLIVSFTVLMLLSCTQGKSEPTTAVTTFPTLTPLPTTPPTSTPLPVPTIPVNSTPGPLPTYCPVTNPMLHSISANLLPMIGAAPVWATWPVKGPMIAHLNQPPGSRFPSLFDPPYGWDITKLIWEVGPNYTQLVTIYGQDIFDHTPLILSFDGRKTIRATLDPSHPGHPFSAVGDNWAEWGSTIVVPKAGCYTVVVSWPQGSWQFTLAAGA